jgi:type I restriction enzyme S subunit
LNSDYGDVLLNALAYGSVVQHIELDHFKNVAFPLLVDKTMQQRINDLAMTANAKRYEAYQLEQEAIRILNDEVIYAK